MASFKLDYPPSINTYWRTNYRVNRTYLSDKGRKYKDTQVQKMWEQDVPRGTPEARYEVLIDAHMPDYRKRDIDNIVKPILDCMEEHGVICDDEQVDILIVRRCSKGGFCIIHVAEIPPEDSLAR